MDTLCTILRDPVLAASDLGDDVAVEDVFFVAVLDAHDTGVAADAGPRIFVPKRSGNPHA